jgi:hypothetical protein
MPTLLTAASLLTLAITVGYAGTCVVWPFGPCRRCHGAGKLKSRLGRLYRLCRRCHGTGLRLRYGRRLYNAYKRLNRDATK